MTITTAEIDSAIPVAGTPSRSLTNALLKTFTAEQQGDFRKTVASRYYPICPAFFAASGAPVANTIYFAPFAIRETTSIDRLSIRVTTGVALGEIRLAVYAASATTGLPTGSALADTGGVAAVVATLIDATVTPVSLTPGIYYFALQGNDITLRWVSISTSHGPLVTDITGADTAAAIFHSSGSMGVTVSASQTYGTWPSNPTVTVAGSTTSLMPLGAYRVTP